MRLFFLISTFYTWSLRSLQKMSPAFFPEPLKGYFSVTKLFWNFFLVVSLQDFEHKEESHFHYTQAVLFFGSFFVVCATLNYFTKYNKKWCKTYSALIGPDTNYTGTIIRTRINYNTNSSIIKWKKKEAGILCFSYSSKLIRYLFFWCSFINTISWRH